MSHWPDFDKTAMGAAWIDFLTRGRNSDAKPQDEEMKAGRYVKKRPPNKGQRHFNDQQMPGSVVTMETLRPPAEKRKPGRPKGQGNSQYAPSYYRNYPEKKND